MLITKNIGAYNQISFYCKPIDDIYYVIEEMN